MAQAEASVIVDSERVRVTSWMFQPGQSYARQAGVEHDVANAGPRTAVFVEVEVKDQG
jgi:mannose-6-phosphate isomerase-like protein (cupin superfamily)